jgi:hypothetical protein
MRKPKVALILGAPHGGTTIANMMLGQHTGVFATGKLRNCPHGDVFSEDKVAAPGDTSCWKCTCGELARECPFWLKIREQYAPSEDKPEREKIPQLFNLILDLSGSEYVGDVTHNADYAQQLMDIPGLDLYLIHIVRDGRGVVFSRIRKDYKLGVLQQRGWDHLNRVFRISRRWASQNREFSRLVKKLGPRGVEVNYDDLCRDPRTALKAIGSCLNLDFTTIGEQLASGQPFKTVPHLIRGNARLRLESNVILRHSPTNLSEMSRLDRAVFQLATRLPLHG